MTGIGVLNLCYSPIEKLTRAAPDLRRLNYSVDCGVRGPITSIQELRTKEGSDHEVVATYQYVFDL